MHVDLDAFFASVEQKASPKLRGRPVAVCGGVKTRTVVSAASYEAKKLGVKSGMTLREAKSRCPGLVLVEGNLAKYADISEKITGIFYNYTDIVEVFSIDEAFLDLTRTHLLFGGPEEIAREIKGHIYAVHGLRASVGIGPGRLVAKLATGMGKPDGLVVIRREEAAGTLAKLPASRLCGVGDKTAGCLASMGIFTCGELAAAPAQRLRNAFGIYGELLGAMARGADESPVRPPGLAKSIGHSLTLGQDTADPERICAVILDLSERVSGRLRGEGCEGRTVCLTLRYSDFLTRTFRRTAGYTSDVYSVYSACRGLFRDNFGRRPVRMVGVGVSGLRRALPQMLLFREEEKQKKLQEAVDLLNRRMGSGTLVRAGARLGGAVP